MRRFEYLLKTYLKETQLLSGVQFGGLVEDWNIILGDFLADKIRPITFKQGVLECMVTHSVLMQEQNYLKAEILKRLQATAFGNIIKSLKFTVSAPLEISLKEWDKIQAMNAGRERYLKALKTKPTQQQPIPNLEQTTASIKDPETRKRVQSLFNAIQQRQTELGAQHWKVCFNCQTYLSPEHENCPYCGKPVILK